MFIIVGEETLAIVRLSIFLAAMSICVVTLEAVTDKSLSEPVLPKLIVVATLAAKEVTKAVPTSIVVAL